MMEIHIFICHIDVEDGNMMDIIIIYYNPFPPAEPPQIIKARVSNRK